jgi:hypothetical protein
MERRRSARGPLRRAFLEECGDALGVGVGGAGGHDRPDVLYAPPG